MARREINDGLNLVTLHDINENFKDLDADGSVTQRKIAYGSVNELRIADDSVGNSKLKTGGVHRENIADNAVSTQKITDGAVYGNKISDRTITSSKYGDSSITNRALAENSVERQNIADDAVNSRKIIDGAVYGNKISDRTIRDNHIHENNAFLSARKIVTVIKTNNNMKILVPGRDNKFICHEMQYWNRPFVPGDRLTNVKVWAIAEVGQYYLGEHGSFQKDDSRVFVHSTGAPTSMETIFKLQGEVDYSGAFHHGDEISDFCKIFVGNQDITNRTGTFTGDSLDMIQHSQLYEDTLTTEAMTDPYLNVRKHHRFDCENVYTLTHEVEFIKTVTPNFSCLGALTLRRTTQDGTGGNFTDVLDLTHMRYVNIRETDDTGNHFRGDKVMKFKCMGSNKDVTVTFQSPDPHFEAYLSNGNPNMAKIYTEVVPRNVEVQAGERFSASANFKWVTYGD